MKEFIILIHWNNPKPTLAGSPNGKMEYRLRSPNIHTAKDSAERLFRGQYPGMDIVQTIAR